MQVAAFVIFWSVSLLPTGDVQSLGFRLGDAAGIAIQTPSPRLRQAWDLVLPGEESLGMPRAWLADEEDSLDDGPIPSAHGLVAARWPQGRGALSWFALRPEDRLRSPCLPVPLRC
jgi:hypothetical protein